MNALREDEAFSALENERDSLRFEIARLGSRKEDTGNLKVSLKKLTEDIAARAKSLGYDIKDSVPDYTCKICSDEGMKKGGNCICVAELVKKLKAEG